MMGYETWEAEQGLSPSSPESYYAEMAWNAAVCEEIERLRAENEKLKRRCRLLSKVLHEDAGLCCEAALRGEEK